MFRVYVEGDSVLGLKKNLLAFAAILGGSSVETCEAEDGPLNPPMPEAMAQEIVRKVSQDAAPVARTFENSVMQEPAPRAIAMPQSTPGEVDSRHFPWDSRIHSSSKAKNKDGSWRYKKNLEQAGIDQVEHELRSRSASVGSHQPIGAPTFATPAAVPQGLPSQGLPQAGPASSSLAPLGLPPQSFAAPQQQAHHPYQQPAPAPQPVALHQPQAPAASVTQPLGVNQNYDPIAIPQNSKPAHDLASFKENFIPTIVQLTKSGSLTPEYLQMLKEHFKVAQLWEVMERPADLQNLFSSLVQQGFITQVG